MAGTPPRLEVENALEISADDPNYDLTKGAWVYRFTNGDALYIQHLDGADVSVAGATTKELDDRSPEHQEMVDAIERYHQADERSEHRTLAKRILHNAEAIGRALLRGDRKAYVESLMSGTNVTRTQANTQADTRGLSLDSTVMGWGS